MKVIVSQERRGSSQPVATLFQEALDREVSSCLSRNVQDRPLEMDITHDDTSTDSGDNVLESNESSCSSRSGSPHQAPSEAPRSILRKSLFNSDAQDKNWNSDALERVRSSSWTAVSPLSLPPGLSQYTEVNKMRGASDVVESQSVSAMARNHRGCQILIERWTSADWFEREAMLRDVFPFLTQHACHPSAHLLVATFLDAGSSEQCRWIAAKLSHEALFLCRDVYGSEVICRALLRKEASQMLVRALGLNFISCSRDVHGHHVMQFLVEGLPPRSLASVVRIMCQFGLKRLCEDRFACKVVQSLFHCCSIEILSPLLDDLQQFSYDLLAHPYGNYVLQAVLVRGRSQDTLKICSDVLLCDVVALRQDRCARVLVGRCVSILGHANTPELRELWSAMCASVASSDMWMLLANERNEHIKVMKSFRQLMLRSSAGAQQEELRRCLALHH